MPTNQTVWTYFNGDDGAKSTFFRTHGWLIHLLFVNQLLGIVFNMFLVGIIMFFIQPCLNVFPKESYFYSKIKQSSLI